VTKLSLELLGISVTCIVFIYLFCYLSDGLRSIHSLTCNCCSCKATSI